MIAAYFEAQMATGQFPHVEQLAEIGHDTREVLDTLMELGRDEGRFERSLRRLLDGIALGLERQT